MVDFILLSFSLGMFAAGWWCGKTFNTVGQAVDAATAKVKGWL